MHKIGVVGAGFSGAVVARGLADTGKYEIVVFESRNHIAGNCYTERDKETGIMLHKYGPHIFHCDRLDVWEFVNRFAKFGQYTNRVKSVTNRGIYSLPINLLTINQFFGKRFNPREAREFIDSLGDKTIEVPRNFEEQALKYLGRELYQNFFYGYTKKQWGVEPRELSASVLKRLPIRFNYDDNYYSSRFQGIPIDGYTELVANILDHPSISLQLGEGFQKEYKSDFDHIFYSGPIDAYFSYELGRLRYRSLVFERMSGSGDFQGNPVINYCEADVPYTRISEHKHFTPWAQFDSTIFFREYSKDTELGDIPYYPLRLDSDKVLLDLYMERVKIEPKITFIGRLGTYRYLDMHAVIGEALDLVQQCSNQNLETWPKFSIPL